MEKNDHRMATILPFTRKRGRPKTGRLSKDTGTPELVMKRLRGETAETLDICLVRGLITDEQHWCGIHLRWLYTLRHGAPSVRAVNPTLTCGIDIKLDDPEWRGAREKEYQDAMKKLAANGHAILLTNICIFNERPKFLIRDRAHKAVPGAMEIAILTQLRDGLDILIRHWKRRPR